MKLSLLALVALWLLNGCKNASSFNPLSLTIYQTSSSGEQLKQLEAADAGVSARDTFIIYPDSQFQSIIGFGGAFTESSAYLLNQLSAEKRREIISAYFGDNGAAYSLTRTHMNSCDFSLSHYSYAPQAGDTLLNSFSIDEDLTDLIPMIKDAQKASVNGFKIIASPWTAPPWMKDNNTWYGGKLKPEYYKTWALFFSKYHQAYVAQGIPIWGFTVENEPLGNDSHWESMHYTPEEMGDFVKNYLGPQLNRDGIEANLLIYDQNRGAELEHWAKILLTDTGVLRYVYGTAVHWYTSTVDWMSSSLQFTHNLAPEKHIIHTEGCVDSEIPHWQDDKWYWTSEATDWGWEWAPEKDKAAHPKYVPAYRYAADIIGCMNNWVEGWIDWNMVLDIHGGPNLASNWCVAPVIVNTETNEVYYTPLYSIMVHFSKFIRPEAKIIACKNGQSDLLVTAAKNTDGSIVFIALNRSEEARTFALKVEQKISTIQIAPEAIQTIVIR